MKIAFIVNRFPILSQSFILNQITGLLDRGHEVDIFSNLPGDEPVIHADVKKYGLLNRTHYYFRDLPSNQLLKSLCILGLAVKYCCRRPRAIAKVLNLKRHKKGFFEKTLSAASSFLDKGPYDIVHCHFGPNGILGVILKDIGAINGKVVTSFHGYDISKYIKKNGAGVYKKLFSKGDKFLPVSKLWKERLIELGCPGEKILVHRMGIDTNKFSILPQERQNNNKIVLLSIARLVEKKGISYAIVAVSRLMKRYASIEYRIVGDGPLKVNLEYMTIELNAQDNVKFLGWKQQEEVITLLKDTDIFLAPSVTGKNGDVEGIPIVLMEALALGLPVISTQHSGIPEIIDDGKSGFLVPERDSDAIAEKLEFLLKHRETGKEMGKYGRIAMEEYYNIDKLNDKLVNIYNQLLAKNN